MDHTMTAMLGSNCLKDTLDFNYIFETYYKRIYNYNYYRLHNQEIAEDLTSQVFEKVMIKLESYSKDKAKFEVWLFTIARNILNDYLRRQKKFIWTPLDDVFETITKDSLQEESILQQEQNTLLLEAVRTLNEKERTMIAYKFGADLKNKEIATLMNMNERHVGVMLHRTLKKLKIAMEGAM